MTDAETIQEPQEPTDADLIKALETGVVPGQEPEADQVDDTQEDPSQAEPAVDRVADTFEANARLERQNRELKSQLAELEELKKAAEESPVEALERLGADPIELLEQMGAVEPKEPVEKVTSELEQIKAEQQRLKQELEQTKLDSFVNKRKEQLTAKMDELAEEFPFARLAAQGDESFLDRMMEEAGKYYHENQELMPDKDLIKLADEHVSGGFYGQLEKVLSVPRGVERVLAELKKLNASSDKPESDKVADKPAVTLSNDDQAEPTREARDLTDEEAEVEFMRAIKEKGWVGD